MIKSSLLTIILFLCFLGLFSQNPNEFETQNSLYRDYVKTRTIENPDTLLTEAQKLLRLDTHFAPAWVLIGKAYSTKSQMPHPQKKVFADSARIAAQKALELDPKSADVLSFAALQDFLSGKIKSSRQHQYALDKTLELSRGLSFSNLNKGRLTEAYKWSDAALTAYPDAVWALRYHGANAYTLGFYEEAEKCFQKIISTAENIDLDVHYKLARLYLATNQMDKAREQYELFRNRRYYAENRMYLSAFLFASQLGMFLGNYEEALEDLNLFLEETHNYWMPPQAYGYQLTTIKAFLLKSANKEAEAETMLSQSLEKAETLRAQGDEGYGVPLDLAAVYALEGNSEMALQHLAQAVEKGFRDAQWLQQNPIFMSLKKINVFDNILKTIMTLVNSDAKTINTKKE